MQDYEQENHIKKLPWLRLYSTTVDNDKLRMLAFEDRWHYIAILCLKRSGLQDEGFELDFLHRRISIKLGLTIVELDSVKKRLLDVHLIDDKFQPVGWDEHQFESDHSNERVKKHRDKKKLEGCNVTTPLPKRNVNALDTEQIQNRTDTHTTTSSPKASDPVPYQQIISLYHEKLKALPKVAKLTTTRKGYIKQRWNEDLETLPQWENFFDHVQESDFLMGRTQPNNGRPPFLASLEWLCKPANFTKIAEGNYHRV